MIVEKGFSRRNRIVGGRGPNPRGRLRLIKETLANIAALVALTPMSGTVTADQTTKTTAQLAIDQFEECAESLFKDEFDPAEVDYELSLNKEVVLFLSAKWRSHDGTINILTRIRAHFARLESGRIPKCLSMSESSGIDSFWGSERC